MINEKHTLALEGEFFEKNMTPFGFKVRAFSDRCNVADLGAAQLTITDHSLLRARSSG